MEEQGVVGLDSAGETFGVEDVRYNSDAERDVQVGAGSTDSERNSQFRKEKTT